jgi:hypothetical protein
MLRGKVGTMLCAYVVAVINTNLLHWRAILALGRIGLLVAVLWGVSVRFATVEVPIWSTASLRLDRDAEHGSDQFINTDILNDLGPLGQLKSSVMLIERTYAGWGYPCGC